jgi:DNA-binding TFAR19-related protein (PDSD5 family)
MASDDIKRQQRRRTPAEKGAAMKAAATSIEVTIEGQNEIKAAVLSKLTPEEAANALLALHGVDKNLSQAVERAFVDLIAAARNRGDIDANSLMHALRSSIKT